MHRFATTRSARFLGSTVASGAAKFDWALRSCATTTDGTGSAVPPTTGDPAAPASSAAPNIPADHTINDFTPKQVVEVLDNFVVGQNAAKRAVAVALRNRWRRAHIADNGLKNDITPKNILMIGPTGVGKSEIARRMAKVTDAPFLKVEATKYTEVGFRGKDVESIIEDLYAVAKNKARTRLEKQRAADALRIAHDSIHTAITKLPEFASLTQAEYFAKLEAGDFKTVTVSVQRTVAPQQPQKRGLGDQAMGIEIVLQGFGVGGGENSAYRETVVRPVSEALEIAKAEALKKLISESSILELAKTLAEDEGVVFIDEIDKVVADSAKASHDTSALGVQQDLLPLVEGCNVTLKDGTVIKTDTILFICSGAFHMVKPADMIAELQGRLPVRVELAALKEEDFVKILTVPTFNLLRQQTALMKVDNITVTFTEQGVKAIARVSAQVNTNAQNIGARRLHTVIERIMDEPSFACEDFAGKELVIGDAEVVKATDKLAANVELSRYLL